MQVPSTPEEIANFVKTASIDDIMRISMLMREKVTVMRKKDEQALKRLEKEAERIEKKKQKEADKEAKRLEKEAIKEAKRKQKTLEKKKIAHISDSDSDCNSDSEYDSDTDSKSKPIPVQQSSNEVPVKRGPGRPKKEKKERKPRAPTEYNLFLKDKMLEIAKEFPEIETRERMKMAVEEWRKKKCNDN